MHSSYQYICHYVKFANMITNEFWWLVHQLYKVSKSDNIMAYFIVIIVTQFKFIVEESASLPVDPKFWDYLFSSAQKDW